MQAWRSVLHANAGGHHQINSGKVMLPLQAAVQGRSLHSGMPRQVLIQSGDYVTAGYVQTLTTNNATGG